QAENVYVRLRTRGYWTNRWLWSGACLGPCHDATNPLVRPDHVDGAARPATRSRSRPGEGGPVAYARGAATRRWVEVGRASRGAIWTFAGGNDQEGWRWQNEDLCSRSPLPCRGGAARCGAGSS